MIRPALPEDAKAMAEVQNCILRIGGTTGNASGACIGGLICDIGKEVLRPGACRVAGFP